MDDIVGKIILAIGILCILFLIIMIVEITISTPKAKECIRNGGEPYYFITSFECKNNINVNLESGD